ncbi:hypothetical protein ILUMI_10495 [Ignelater luminosus]|uniref:cystathionine gamma-lyase n=1 Tax=Ignelater luminosus TaxID=2038154 RepID=A0A8K0CXW9_IGNLU|nr:hypothetical protein ILUMI_10495 [Ignelater luminosus]
MGDNKGFLPLPKGFSTVAIHSGQDPEQWDSLSVVPPLVLSTTFKQLNPENLIASKYEYARTGNPSRNVLEECLAALEGAKYGLCFSSGLGAVTALLGLLKSGDHIICGDIVYGGSNKLFCELATPMGITTSFTDVTNLSYLEKAINSNTKIIFLETPMNPVLKVADIKAVSEMAKKRNILLVVDNTFLTPYLQKPLELGADLSLYSLTKYMNGHADVVMGAILLNNPEIHKRLRLLQSIMGIVPSPFDCSQVNRSLKTLALRMRQHSQSSLLIAKFLESHPKVEEVIHPGLPSHPQHELSKRQTSGHSGMVAMYIKGGLEARKRFLSALKVFTFAASLGDCESLIEIPSIMTHTAVPEDQRRALKITDNLLRLSVGSEDVKDLINDLK